MAHSKRILIVDDEPNVTLMLAASLGTLGEEYVLEEAHTGEEALLKLKQDFYTLLLTDYNMPGMSGVDLAQKARAISPGTRVVMMTAYGTDRLRETVHHMELDGYIDKPATTAQIREIVMRAIGQTKQIQASEDLFHTGEQPIAALDIITALRANTGARCVLLLSSGGYPAHVVGHNINLDIASISALVAANFLAATELANLLGSNTSVFKSSYHEGNDYNIYAYKINAEFLLTVIFGTESKPGAVWFYTKKAAAELEPLVIHQPAIKFEVADTDVESTLNLEFDQLFNLQTRSDEVEDESILLSNTPQPQNTQPPAQDQSNSNPKPMTFEQALAAGLVPAQIAQRELNQK